MKEMCKNAAWEWPVTAEWFRWCVVPHSHHMCLSLSLSLCPPLLLKSLLLSIPCYQPGCRHGDRPRRGAHEAQTACLTLSFLSVLSARGRTPSGGAIQCDKLLSHPKKTACARTPSHAWSWRKHIRMCCYQNLSHICRHATNHTDILNTGLTPVWMCTNTMQTEYLSFSLSVFSYAFHKLHVHLRGWLCVYWLAYYYKQLMSDTGTW